MQLNIFLGHKIPPGNLNSALTNVFLPVNFLVLLIEREMFGVEVSGNVGGCGSYLGLQLTRCFG